VIPCPVCLVVLDGGGGQCATHAQWFTCKLWFPGEWPTLEELAANVETTKQTTKNRSIRLVESLADNRARLLERAHQVISRAQLPKLSGRVFVGFRHFRSDAGGDRASEAHAVSLILAELVRAGRFAHDQVEGIAHLFYRLEDGPPGPYAPIERGVQLFLAERD
jgi:hypothetical protein